LVTYMVNPSVQLIIDGADRSTLFDSAEITRIENGFDTATVTVSDVASALYPASIAAGKTISLGVKAASDGAYTTVLNGLIRYCKPLLSKQGEYLVLKVDGTGYGFGESACNQQYGTESNRAPFAVDEEVYTNAFSSTTVDWAVTGADPYLNDSDDNFIYTAEDGELDSYWTFPNSAGSGTINSVKIRFEANRVAVAGNKIQPEVWDGAAWVDMGALTLTNGYSWVEVDVSATLNTWAKINGCRIRINSVVVTGVPMYVRRLTRKVNHTTAATEILDTISEILNDAKYGVIPKHVNMILGSGASGYAYDFANIDAIVGEGVIPFYQSPFKPCLAVVNDLCDLVSAQTADGNNGPHWIVDTDSKFRLKQLGATQAGWTRYYGDSAAASTLAQGVDFEDYGFEHADSEANYVLFYGVLRKPAQDYWCEGHAASWGHNANMNTITDDAVLYKVGANSLRLYNAGGAGGQAYWPSTQDAAWDFTKIGSEQNPPTFNTYGYYDTGSGDVWLKLCTDADNYFYDKMHDTEMDKWLYYSKRVGPYYRRDVDWSVMGAPSWSNINYVEVRHPLTLMVSNWDDMHFEGLICRAARDATLIGTDKLKLKTTIDSVGKDDTMKSGVLGTSDIGTMGQLVHSELRRARTKPLTGTVTVPMIKDALAGQTFHIHGKKTSAGTFNIDKDMRAITIKHTIRTSGLWTQLTLTDDFLNSRPRQPYAQLNSLLAAVRPEYQDRQATNIKAASVDIRVPILLENYPS